MSHGAPGGGASAQASRVVWTTAPFRTAFRSQTESASSDQSVASTSAPRSAATTLGSPSPQPSSRTRAPASSRPATTRASAIALGHSSAQYGRNSSRSNASSLISSSASGGWRTVSASSPTSTSEAVS